MTQATLPDEQTAQQVVVDHVDKRAYFECLEQLGHVPNNEAEAEALYGLGMKIAEAEADPILNKEAAGQQGPGPYAFASKALDNFLGKSASAPAVNASGLDDVSIAGAMELAGNPEIFASALVLKAAQEAAAAA